MTYKAARGDKEALVVGKGINSMILQLYASAFCFIADFNYRPDGITFSVPEPEEHLKIGDIAMFTFDNYSRNSIPVNPSIYRTRTDVTWENVVYDFFKESQSNSDEFLGTFYYSSSVHS